ncbi:MAG: polysaccharide biosynthesis tyrosine autokinase [Anaerolineae bacterium]|nr:polysaccharide biosynthesis tyrosine autokinase [Anaerolineae bacterium]
MELIQYIRLFRRWLWLILLLTFVAGGISFIVATSRPAVYEAQTTIAIGRFIESPNPDTAEIRTGIELAQTYTQLVKTYDVLQGTVDTLDLPLTADELQEIVETRILSGTSLIVISVLYTDPVLAADIANEIAQQLILQSPTNLTQEQEEQISFANNQIDALNNQLRDGRLQLELIDSQLSEAETEEEINRLTSQRNSTIDQINQASATVAQFSNTIIALQQRTNALDIVERARVPTIPSGISVLGATILAAIIGAVVATGIALLIEYLDETIRTTDEATQVTGLPVLGAIVRFGNKNDTYPDRLLVEQPTWAPAVEGYRTLRTNLLFGETGELTSIYLITSPNPEEGKSVTAANLAVTMANAGLQVLLIDADLRRPKLHEIFNLENSVGLTTLLAGGTPDHGNFDSGSRKLPVSLLKCLQTTTLPKLWVITSGFVPPNPTELLGSVLLRRWVQTFRMASEIDVVLIDTPPCLVAADSSVLAASIGAEVLMVVDCGRTRGGAATKAVEQFRKLNATVKGIVVNRINPRDERYEYGYNYGYYYSNIPQAQIKNEAKLKDNGHAGISRISPRR